MSSEPLDSGAVPSEHYNTATCCFVLFCFVLRGTGGPASVLYKFVACLIISFSRAKFAS